MRRLVFFVLLIVVLLAGALSLPFLLQPDKQRAKIEASLSQLLQRPVVIGECALGFLPPTLKLKRVAALNEQKETFLLAESVTGPLNLKELFRLKFIPEEVDVERWSVTIHRKVNGTWDYHDWWPRATSLDAAKTGTLKRIHWQRGEIHWMDVHAGAPQELVLSLVEGNWSPRPELLEASGSFSGPLTGVGVSFSARGKFFANPQWTGDLEINEQSNVMVAHLSQSPKGFELKGQSAKWRLSPVSAVLQFLSRIPMRPSENGALILENWNFLVKSDGPQMMFEQTGQIGGGAAEVKGKLVPSQDGMQLQMDAAVSAIPVEALYGLIGENIAATGKVTGITKGFQMVFSTRTSSTAQGMGYLEVKDGHYRPPETSIKWLSKAKTMGYIRKKYPDFLVSGLPFSRLSAHWQAKNGTLTADNGLLVTPTIKAGWVGHINLARQGMDGFVRLNIQEKDPKLKALIPVKYDQQPAFGRLQGNWNEWSLRATPSSRIPAATQAALRKALAQK